MTIQEYIRAVDEQFQTGVAHEHAYRPALQQLLDEMLPNYTVTNEPSAPQNLLPPRFPHHPHRHWQPHSLGKEEVKRLMQRRRKGDGSEKEGRWDGEGRYREYHLS